MDLSKYSLEELRELQKDLERELRARRKEEARRAQKELKEVAEKYGFSLSDLVGASPARTTAKGKPRFRHPDDASKTWSGRGRKPFWIKDWEASGRSLSELAID
ncbi:H-NS family nucleoid-associated regulatory protein [Alkalilimnicola sp. S0819]|uniref:H-NS histone family protein n=1 Tax=Alkalilimnicola sp. S0819 TaxID=2613922 RepID=UPI001261B97D|nr:H-NS histone family protein [Alkalilimnicola sp. S0819]KAB7628411.1 H-NS histone family protein [Alkalilimnicola sp. S0819]MPQ15314.1 H-NS histone family protein [Alkalilimnicola sp. S0819]